VQLQITFLRLGCGVSNENQLVQLVQPPSTEQKEQLRSKYVLPRETTIEMATKTLVGEIQLLLRHMHYIPLKMQINGFYDDITMEGVKKFQEEFDEADLQEKLNPTGYMDPVTLGKLSNTIFNVVDKIAPLGFRLEEDQHPIHNYKEFNDNIRKFQIEHKMNPTGLLDKRTLLAIDKMLVHYKNIRPNSPENELNEEPDIPPNTTYENVPKPIFSTVVEHAAIVALNQNIVAVKKKILQRDEEIKGLQAQKDSMNELYKQKRNKLFALIDATKETLAAAKRDQDRNIQDLYNTSRKLANNFKPLEGYSSQMKNIDSAIKTLNLRESKPMLSNLLSFICIIVLAYILLYD